MKKADVTELKMWLNRNHFLGLMKFATPMDDRPDPS
jgi:hypothetical protein